jgi:glutathione synthase/RimK-type ligase-like ATP-grasp enzyme
MEGNSFTFGMPSIAFATYASLPDLAPDEHPLIDALAALGIESRGVVWDDASVDWKSFDAVVIRSCWDYHLRYFEFFKWIADVEALGVPIWNAPSTLRWNSKKTYLHDLAIAGVRIVPTYWLEGEDARQRSHSLEAIMTDTGSHVAIVKPVVSASAHQTFKVTRDDAHENASTHDARLKALADGEGGMVQPFIPEIESQGEWSMMFFGGAFSHAVVKRAAPGEFRVQREFGGTHETVTPSSTVLSQAERALRAAPGDSLYARVDGVVLGGELVLTELELLEPSLFLDADPEAPRRLAEAVAAKVR